MSGVLNLRNDLELVDYAFNNGSFAQEDFVMQKDQVVAHVLSHSGDQLNAKGFQEQFKKRL
jgi:hypothetical protein